MNKIEKCSKTQLNRIVIHLGDIEKRIYQNELESYLQLGWELGISESKRQKLSNSHKGQVAWNKGLTKETNVSIQEMSKKLTGITHETTWNKGLDITDSRVQKAVNKAVDTKIKKYGNGFGPSNNMTEEHKKKISNATKGKKHKLSPQKLKIKLTKDYITKKKNNTFNVSKPEEMLYKELLEANVNKTIYRQYKDEKRYPFYCDFYIVEDDLFIELNAHWSHGGHPFDKTNEEDLCKLAIWQEKAKTSKFYQIAIETWTIRDVKKLEYAKKYKLNYKVIY